MLLLCNSDLNRKILIDILIAATIWRQERVGAAGDGDEGAAAAAVRAAARQEPGARATRH